MSNIFKKNLLSASSAVMSEHEFNKAEQSHKEYKFKSRFAFLNSHNGIRPGQCHYLLGSSGCGKSSLARAIAIDCAIDHKVLIHLSEESETDYKYKINHQLNNKKILENLFLTSESGAKRFKGSPSVFVREFIKDVELFNPSIVFFDNLTTSYIYNSCGLREQAEVLDELNGFCQGRNLPIFYILHTKKEIDDNITRLITPEDSRGTNYVNQIAPYFYVFQNFRSNAGNNATLRIAKARFHNVGNKLFALNYSLEKETYLNDKEIGFHAFMDMFRARYKLTEG